MYIAANYTSEVVDTLPSDMETGIYYGYAKVDDGPVYKMVMSIGWNPYYKNVKKSMVKITLFYISYLFHNHFFFFRKHIYFINLKLTFMAVCSGLAL
jgi:riboflavin kinase